VCSKLDRHVQMKVVERGMNNLDAVCCSGVVFSGVTDGKPRRTALDLSVSSCIRRRPGAFFCVGCNSAARQRRREWVSTKRFICPPSPELAHHRAVLMTCSLVFSIR